MMSRHSSLKPSSATALRNLSWLTSGFFIIFILGTGAIYNANHTRPIINLLTQQDWSHFPNSEKVGNGLRIKPSGQFITHRDTSAAQINSPVNVQGAHLKVNGDFKIKANLVGVNNGSSLQLYGQVPIIYDEWRQERESLLLEADHYGLRVRILDGTAGSAIDERIYDFISPDNLKIEITHRRGRFEVNANNKRLGFIPDHNIFKMGTVWFGADAQIGTEGWILQSLTAQSLNKVQAELARPPAQWPSSDPPDSLRNLAAKNPRHLPIGAAVAANPLFTDEQYKNILLTQFSMMTPENSMKPQFIHPRKDLYQYQEADSLVDVAIQNQMTIHGHALVLGKANPRWMEKVPKAQRRQTLIDHINNVVGHFKGRVAEWDVVNEPLSEDDVDYAGPKAGLRPQMWSDALGEDYLDISFRSARAVDPAAKLYLNEFGLEKDGIRWSALLGLVQRLQARGVPIDGVGFESHVYRRADLINPEILKQHIQALARLGIVSRVSEIDVLGEDSALQASQYADILKVCLDEPSCTSFGTWGVIDLYGSTTLSDRYPIKLGSSLLWDKIYAPKPAVGGLQKVLQP